MSKAIAILAVLMLLPAQPVLAQDAARAQIQAATSNAVISLRAEIYQARITPTLSVAEFLDQTNSEDALMETIQQAQQIGGPRWIDDSTCQVRLELSGQRVAFALTSIAAVRPKLSPLPAAVMEQRLANWKDRTFSGTGTSISAAKLGSIRPPMDGDGWDGVSDDARRQAVDSARQNAVNYIIESIRPIDLGRGETIGDVLARGNARESVSRWLESQPVTDVRFKQDLNVEIKVSAPPDDLLATVLKSIQPSQGAAVPTDQKQLDELKLEFARRVSGAIGRAGVLEKPKPADDGQVTITLPPAAPEWVGQPLDAEGIVESVGSKLRTKVAAENKATDALRARINSLPLSAGRTVQDAAKTNPRIAEVVENTLLRARVYSAEYRDDGSVKIRVTIDSRDLWDDLRQVTGQ